MITNETGAIVEKREFKTFGQRSMAFADASLRTGFTGQEHDTELGLVNMRGRLYDPKLRRFITPDPFVTRPLSPQGLNRFAYVTNSPMNFVDPSGFDGTPPDRSGSGGGGGNVEQGSGQTTGSVTYTMDGGSSSTVSPSFGTDRITGQTLAQVVVDCTVSPGYSGDYSGSQGSDRALVRGEGGGQAAQQGPSGVSMGPTSPSGSAENGGSTSASSGPSSDARGAQDWSGDGRGQTSGSDRAQVVWAGVTIALPPPGASPWVDVGNLLGSLERFLSSSAAVVAGSLAAGLLATSDSSRDIKDTAVHAKPGPAWPGNDPKIAPPGTNWTGKPGSNPGGKDGNYHNPETGESFRPDLEHGDPIGPHWDYRAPDGTWNRIMPDGTVVPK